MKKNKPMRAAGILLLATMLTTCMTAGSFAKYTTGHDANDSARVAKFGVIVSADGTLFGKQYTAGTGTPANTIMSYDSTSTEGTVQVNERDAADTNVVAPGTKNETGLGFGVTGTPEVDTEVTLKVDAMKNVRLNMGTYGVMVDVTDSITAVNWESFRDQDYGLYTLNNDTYTRVLSAVDAPAANTHYFELHDAVDVTNTYYPVLYKLDTARTDYNTDSLAAAMNEYVTKVMGDDTATLGSTTHEAKHIFNANTDLGTTLGGKTLTWEWAFERTEGTDGNDITDPDELAANKAKYNGADTILGDLAAVGVTVVKLDGTGNLTTIRAIPDNANTFKAPTGLAANAAFDDADNTDYNIHTALDFSITVTQVD